ncbi:alpha/beta hydrolase family protein [Paenibacillus cellulosilyticus]|uniref:Alpha/beta hydrolase family protein n=1 Tax=Paenibacillus cellulosilyticus TaxID=375489 RepID=A0A2V2YNS6_9BACL|nr:alpha/beta hydrolase family protein [Paenibacillus cellulosilyticus]PWV97325.1 alpha/beta hydrolase family protein [Paenibacillus cellulosilyticus]QKS47476.1 dienelactone hydrolase family protein [Paenibacillus cellulosilyticus]
MRQGDAALARWYEEQKVVREQRAAQQTAEERKLGLLGLLHQSLGEFERTSGFEPVLLERTECDGYIRERVELSAVSGLAFGAYVLIPEGASGRLPGVVAVHGHGYGSRQICGMTADGQWDTTSAGGHSHFAVQLVKRGMIVIAPDVIGFGERRLESDIANDPNAPNSCYRMATKLLMLGKTLTGLRVTEIFGALDYFMTRPDVDPARIGIAGFSGGSVIGYTAAALDQRIGAALLIGYPNTFKDSIWDIRHCICNYTPGLLSEAELPELLGLIAPRPLFLESGSNDPIFPAEGFERAAAELRRLYGEANAEDRLAYDLFEGGHEVSGRQSFDWLKQQLEAIPIL